MPRAVAVPLRRRLLGLAGQQLPASDIAAALGLSERTARRVLRLGPADRRPKYDLCGRRPRACPEALDLRREHPRRGEPYVRVVLQEQPGGPRPSARTLPRHFAGAGPDFPPTCETPTPHLFPKGNELDVFFETDQEKPAPVAIAATPFTAFARLKDGEVKELKFECAPAGEQPGGEREGTCLHFVAKAPWLKRDEGIELTIPSLKIGSATPRVHWKGFTPAKYAHHEE